MATAAPPGTDLDPVGVRIGELSRRVGVSAELLRAWERRYRLLNPARTTAGYRLYSGEDELRVRAMLDQLSRGLSAAEAARVARGRALTPGPDRADAVTGFYEDLRRALDHYDEATAHGVMDAMLRELSLPTALRDVVMPYLADLGARWADGTVDVAQEHFASNLLRGRLSSLALGWGQGVGPLALLACPEGEHHDLPLMAFGIVLNRCGWRVTYLGTSTPVAELRGAAKRLDPDVVVLSATTPEPFEAAAEGIGELAAVVEVLLAGAGATADVGARTGTRVLAGDPVTEAQRLHVPSKRSASTLEVLS